MFTGIIEEIGTISTIHPLKSGKRIFINCTKVLNNLKVDDSVAVNGVCLTAVQVEHNGFWADAVGETLTKTTLDKVFPNMKVNLERALRLSDRLGGHLVQGHVNGTGKLTAIINRGEAYLLEFTVPNNLIRYFIEEGSIAINGISLTIARLIGNKVSVSVIPHTWNNTTFKYSKVGDEVNLEVDLIAKYVENMIKHNKQNEVLTIERLREEGF